MGFNSGFKGLMLKISAFGTQGVSVFFVSSHQEQGLFP